LIYAFHGNLGEPQDWAAVLEFLNHEELNELTGGSSVELWNLYNCLEHSMESFADKTNLEARSKKSGKNILFGYSLGGRLAFQCLAQNPKIWDAAVIVSAHPGLKDASERDLRFEQDQKWSEEVLKFPWPEFWGKWCEQPALKDSPWGADRPEGPAEATRIATAMVNWSLGRQEDLSSQIAACGLPILLVSGENDSKYRKIASSLSALAKNIEHVEILGSGHRVLREKPIELAGEIRSFLGRCFRAKN